MTENESELQFDKSYLNLFAAVLDKVGTNGEGIYTKLVNNLQKNEYDDFVRRLKDSLREKSRFFQREKGREMYPAEAEAAAQATFREMADVLLSSANNGFMIFGRVIRNPFGRK